MVAQAWTPRAVMALFPQYIFRRFDGYDEEPIAREAGVSKDAITFNRLESLAYAPQIADNGILSDARYRWRRPYLSRDRWTPIWDELTNTGYAERSGQYWVVSMRGTRLCEDLHRAARRYLESLDVARNDLRRLGAGVSALAEKTPPEAERTMRAHIGLPLQDEINSHMLRIDRAISELWNFRDDSHVAAWQAAGYYGPTIDVLSQAWEGISTVDEMALELEARQERGELERNIDILVGSGDIARDRDSLALTTQGRERRESIERDTDSRYFRDWPMGDDLARLGNDLAALVSALP